MVVSDDDVRWAEGIAGRMGRSNRLRSVRLDLAAAARLGLAVAASRAADDSPVPLRGYAVKFVRGAVMRERRRHFAYGFAGIPSGRFRIELPGSLERDRAPGSAWEGTPLRLAEFAADSGGKAPIPVPRGLVESLVGDLPSPHRTVVSKVYGLRGYRPRSVAAVAKERGWDAPLGREIVASALAMLRTKLEAMGVRDRAG